MKLICIFGDSVAWGAWDREKGGWVERLKLYLWSVHNDYEVYNLGISGDTTVGILKRFDVECEARKPELIIFATGLNDDIIRKPDGSHLVEIDEFEKNVKELIRKARKLTDAIVWVGLQNVDETRTTPIPWHTDYSYYNKEIQEYDAKLQEVTKQEGVLYLSMFGLLSNEELEDGVHPTPNGHQKIFEKVKNFLIEEKII